MTLALPKTPHSSALILVGIGFFFLICSLLPPLRSSMDDMRRFVLTTFDQLVGVPEQFLKTIVITADPRVLEQNIETLEKENRHLYSVWATCQTNMLASPSATQSASHPTTLSFAGGQWIILSGSHDGVQEGETILFDSVYFGRVMTVNATYSTVETISTSNLPLLIQHVKSGAAAVARGDTHGVTAQFTKRIEGLAVGDLFVTVPDGAHTHTPYPVAVVSEIVSASTDSVSTVRLKPIVAPVIGKVVDRVIP